MPKTPLRRLERGLTRATPSQQRLFLARLPRLLDLRPSDLALLRAAEPSFAFWDNADDAAYDDL